ncbi:MAG: porin family protein [Rickettsiaceae bacterium]|nr:porin family protein [Rickettsiaceae bacterium]
MKKLLLASAAVAALSTSAFAADDSMFYLRGDFGFHMLSKGKKTITDTSHVPTGTPDVKIFDSKMKAKNLPSLEFGIGYNVMENVRAELVYSYLFNVTTKGSDNKTIGNYLGAPTLNAGAVVAGSYTYPGTVVAAGGNVLDVYTNKNFTNKAKTSIQALMVKGYYDVAELGFAQIFVGVGIGMSQITTKHSQSADKVQFESAAALANGANAIYPEAVTGITPTGAVNVQVRGTAAGTPGNGTTKESWTVKEKKKNNLTWSVALGSAFDVTDSVKIDLQYNFQDFGKSSGKGTNAKLNKSAFRTHSIKAGVRFAI